jgi:RNA polymerase sigma factor (sigma-70 family)
MRFLGVGLLICPHVAHPLRPEFSSDLCYIAYRRRLCHRFCPPARKNSGRHGGRGVCNYKQPGAAGRSMSVITPEHLGELLDRHGPALVLLARQWTAHPEDVVQEALVRLAGQRPPPDRPAAWLFHAVRNGAISAARSESRRRRRETAVARERAWFLPAEKNSLDADAATEALSSLPIETREIIVAHIWGELPFDEIAQMTGQSKSAAHRQYQAGLAALRERLINVCPKNDR